MTNTKMTNKILSGTTEVAAIYIGDVLVWNNGTNGHDYVEIGGTKWAIMNIGASSETDIGLYFLWGDIQGYSLSEIGSNSGLKYFGWDDYKYKDPNSSSSTPVFTKYNLTDVRDRLDISDDAARANWGGNWRMPTTEEFETLFNSTTLLCVTSYNGINCNGLLLTDKQDSSKKLFFPYTTLAENGNATITGGVWTCDANKGYVSYTDRSKVESAYMFMYFKLNNNSAYINLLWYNKCYGCNIRPVLDLSDRPENQYEYVDLGLPSGTLWSTKNIGASHLTDIGYIVQWGKISRSKENPYTTGTSLNSISSDNRYDIASYITNGEYRIPTSAEITELINNCTITIETLYGNNSLYKFTSNINGNYILISKESMTSSGSYWQMWLWAGESSNSDSSKASTLHIWIRPLDEVVTWGADLENCNKSYFLPIRPVKNISIS